MRLRRGERWGRRRGRRLRLGRMARGRRCIAEALALVGTVRTPDGFPSGVCFSTWEDHIFGSHDLRPDSRLESALWLRHLRPFVFIAVAVCVLTLLQLHVSTQTATAMNTK